MQDQLKGAVGAAEIRLSTAEGKAMRVAELRAMADHYGRIGDRDEEHRLIAEADELERSVMREAA